MPVVLVTVNLWLRYDKLMKDMYDCYLCEENWVKCLPKNLIVTNCKKTIADNNWQDSAKELG